MKRLVLCLIVLNVCLVADRFFQGFVAGAASGGHAGVDSCASEVGDVDASGLVDITDGITILKFLFFNDPAELSPACFALDPDLESRIAVLENSLGAVESSLGTVESSPGTVESSLGSVATRLITAENAIDALENDTTLSDLACDDGQIAQVRRASGFAPTLRRPCADLAPPVPSEEILQVDEFTQGDSASFQAGFVAGEEAAVTLGPLTANSTVGKVLFLFGGSASQETVTIRIYEDTPATADPGTLRFEGDFSITGSNEDLQEIDLSAQDIVISAGGSFRVSIGMNHAGLPSVARDSDGEIDEDHNWINAMGFGWVPSNLLGITGDWVIRMVINQ